MNARKLATKLAAITSAGMMFFTGMVAPVYQVAAESVDVAVDFPSDYPYNYNGTTISKTYTYNGNSYTIKIKNGNTVSSSSRIHTITLGDEKAICIQPSTTVNSTKYSNEQYEDEPGDYWNALGSDIQEAIGIVMYYGFPNASTNDAYYCATQMLVWELVLGIRDTDFTVDTDSKLLDKFTYSSSGNATKSKVKSAYDAIVSASKTHYDLPTSNPNGSFAKTKSASENTTVKLTYNFSNNDWEGTLKVNSASGMMSTDEDSLKSFRYPIEDAIDNLSSSWGYYNEGATLKVTNGTLASSKAAKVYSVSIPTHPFGSGETRTTSKITADTYKRSGVTSQTVWTLKGKNDDGTYQALVTGTSITPASGYVTYQTVNYSNLTVKKTFKTNTNGSGYVTDSNSKEYLGEVQFTVKTSVSGTTMYVVAHTSGSGYVFDYLTSDSSKATKFVIQDINSSGSQGSFTLCELPANESSRTYYVNEILSTSSEAAKAGYTAQSTANKVTIEPYDSNSADENPNTATTTFTNKVSYDYTDSNFYKYIPGGDYSSVKVIAFVNIKGNLRYLTNLSGSNGEYKADVDEYYEWNSSGYTKDIYDAQEMTLDSSGQLHIDNLPEGTVLGYIEVENSGDYGYSFGESTALDSLGDLLGLNSAGTSGLVTISDAGYAADYHVGETLPFVYGDNMTLYNAKYYVTNITIQKNDSDSTPLPGATFALYKYSNGTYTYLTEATTNDDGIATFYGTFYVNDDSVSYYWKEIEAPSKYVIPDENKAYNKINFNSDGQLSLLIAGSILNSNVTAYYTSANASTVNIPEYGAISVHKVDSDTNKSMAGVTFEITTNQALTADEIKDAHHTARYNDASGTGIQIEAKNYAAGDVIATVTTDSSGYAYVSELPLGTDENGVANFSYTYTATEVEVAEPYVLTENEINYSFDESNYNAGFSAYMGSELVLETETVYNTTEKVRMSISKTDEDGTIVEGAVFKVYADEDIYINNTLVAAAGDEVGEMTTGSDGVARNYTTSGYVDADTEITDYDFDFVLYPGFQYHYEEVSAPVQYVVDSTPVVFECEFDGEEVADLSFTAVNNYKKGTISITKVDSETFDTLEGAEFEIFNDVDGDGEYNDEIDTIVDDVEITYNGEGVYTSSELRYGTYLVHESESPYGFLPNDMYYPFSITENEQVIDIGNYTDDEGNTLLTNVPAKAAIKLTKVDAEFTDAILSGAEFTLYTDVNENGVYDEGIDEYYGMLSEMYTGNDDTETDSETDSETEADISTTVSAETDEETGETVIAVTLEEEAESTTEETTTEEETEETNTEESEVESTEGETTEEESETENTGDAYYYIDDLRFGNYLVKETKAPENYRLDENYYSVKVEEDGAVYVVENEEGVGFTDEAMRGTITLTKVDEEYPDNKLTGAEFEVYNDVDGDGVYTVDVDTLVGELEETEEGIYTLDELRMGDYLVHETKAPENFRIDDNYYAVTLEEDEQVVEVENEAGVGFVDSAMRGSITLTKVDEEYPDNKLTGAEFEVYSDVDGDGEYTEDVDTVIGELEETEDGIYTIDELRMGDYLVHETKAPETFRIDENYYAVKITEDGEVVVVENEAGVGFVNTPMKGGVEITKTDVATSETLPDTGIRIYNSDDEVIFEAYTDENGQITFDDLRIGTYYFQEYDAPDGYYINEEKYEFTISEDGQVVKAVMTDEAIPTTTTTTDDENPKTGLIPGMMIPITILGSGAIGISLYILVRKKKSGEN